MRTPAADATLSQARALLREAQGLTSRDAHRAAALAEQAAELARGGGETALEADALIEAAYAHASGGEHARAVEAGRLGLQRAQEARDGELTATALHTLGIVFEGLGDWDRAMSQLVEALALREAAGHAGGRLRVLNSIGVVYSRSGQPEEGLRVYREVLALQRTRGETGPLCSTLNNIGINLKNLGRLDEAETALQEALALAGEPAARASTAHNLGEVYALQGRGPQAEVQQRAALDAALLCGWRTCEAESRLALAALLGARAAHDEAAALLEGGRATFEASPAGTRARWQAALAGLRQARGDHPGAYQALQEAARLEREGFQEGADRRLRHLQVSFELERARLATEREREHRAALQAAYDALRAADREKSLLVARLDRLAREDALTGLANRRAFNEGLEAAFRAARAQRTVLSVVLLDLDDFKRVNDLHGHATGDLVLQGVAAVLARHARPGWLAARYGGEEFALILPGLPAREAERLCEALRAELAAQPWADCGLPWAQTASLGLSDDPLCATPERLVAQADHWLYHAKHTGKNRVCRAPEGEGPGH